MTRTSSSGLTLIELLLVIAIIAILGAATTPFLSNFIVMNNLTATTNKLLGVITKAQQYALDGKDNAVWGICLSGNNLRLFSGFCASPVFSEDFALPSTITISGLSETTFSPQRGEPSAPLNLTVRSTIDQNTVTLNAAGGLNVN